MQEEGGNDGLRNDGREEGERGAVRTIRTKAEHNSLSQTASCMKLVPVVEHTMVELHSRLSEAPVNGIVYGGQDVDIEGRRRGVREGARRRRLPQSGDRKEDVGGLRECGDDQSANSPGGDKSPLRGVNYPRKLLTHLYPTHKPVHCEQQWASRRSLRQCGDTMQGGELRGDPGSKGGLVGERTWENCYAVAHGARLAAAATSPKCTTTVTFTADVVVTSTKYVTATKETTLTVQKTNWIEYPTTITTLVEKYTTKTVIQSLIVPTTKTYSTTITHTGTPSTVYVTSIQTSPCAAPKTAGTQTVYMPCTATQAAIANTTVAQPVSYVTFSTASAAATGTASSTLTGACATIGTPAWIAGPCYNSVLAANPYALDGNYDVTLATGQTVSIYCAKMASGQPTEYINLAEGYSQNLDMQGLISTQLNFTKARVLLYNASTSYIDLMDLTFATASGYNAPLVPPGPYGPFSLGEANACSFYQYANTVIDITGTNFSIVSYPDPEKTMASIWGWNPNPTWSLTSQRLQLSAEGGCGGGVVRLNSTSTSNNGLVTGAVIAPCYNGNPLKGTYEYEFFGIPGYDVEYDGPRNRVLEIGYQVMSTIRPFRALDGRLLQAAPVGLILEVANALFDLSHELVMVPDTTLGDQELLCVRVKIDGRAGHIESQNTAESGKRKPSGRMISQTVAPFFAPTWQPLLFSTYPAEFGKITNLYHVSRLSTLPGAILANFAREERWEYSVLAEVGHIKNCRADTDAEADADADTGSYKKTQQASVV
ncbi:hypothetical protein BDK51DRAFT_32366 [Blyttiomyces helicus]|uniref:GON domain-containing protein n=1 Tax=Blyttiomyces helicus TaxID=388810 RepID=A0A4P9WI28_9FUNG|nr:hypothetical protein BDK51DRAFT_32366 [Blyttiomyces helicus]|eukprot:RKO92509.1 hypothetical protein BDK51DRAFT_32366 [Blyttiomyces helicus]